MTDKLFQVDYRSFDGTFQTVKIWGEDEADIHRVFDGSTVISITAAPQCTCAEFAGDDPNCPVHGVKRYMPTAADLEEGAESREASRMISELRSM